MAVNRFNFDPLAFKSGTSDPTQQPDYQDSQYSPPVSHDEALHRIDEVMAELLSLYAICRPDAHLTLTIAAEPLGTPGRN